jgi:hypothetical protein
MSDPLGLSIGTTNLVAARVGNQPVMRRSVLPIAGQVLSGFVERVGDPVPLIADDGISYRADVLMVEALDAMVVEAGGEASQIAVAVPAHWKGSTLRSLRDAMRTKPSLAPNGVPVRLVSDAVAALTALGANPGLPVHGVVALLDFGGGGTSITLADAAASFEPIETTRLTEFSGDQIDQSLLAHVLDEIAGDVDPAGTASVGSLTRLREACRQAKEELSEATEAEIRVELPGHQSAVRVSRDQLDALMEAPLAAVLSELEESLLRNRIAPADLSAVVAVGGGARIPLVTRRLTEGDRNSLVTTPHPALDAAVGAALFAAYGADADAQTGVAPMPLITGAMASAAPDSSTFRALAWSQDDDTVGDPTPYTGEDPYADPYADSSTTRVVAQYHPRQDDEPRSWQRLPLLLFGVAAVVALVAVGGVAIALTSATDETRPTPTTAPVTATSPPAPPPTSIAPPPPPPTTEAPPQNVVTVTSEAPPPPPPTETVTVERPVTTTMTTTQPTTTTTTTPPTTTTTTTTPTTTTTTTSTTPTMTTSYITVPFVPVPIPIQVPATPTPQQTYQPYQPYPPYQPPVYQQPQYPY